MQIEQINNTMRYDCKKETRRGTTDIKPMYKY